MSTRPSTRPLLTASLGALLLLGTMSAHGGTPAAPKTGTRAVTAAATSSSTVNVTGWATFSGVNVAAGTSKKEPPDSAVNAVGADLIGAQLVYRPELADLYLRWQVQKLPTLSLGVGNAVGNPAILYGLRTSIGAVPIEIRARSTGASVNGSGALYELWTCETEDACVLKADLSNGCPGANNPCGGFGTTGEEIVLAIPLKTLATAGLPLNEGNKIATPIAYTSNTPNPLGRVPVNQYADSIVMAKTATVTIPAKSVRVTVGKTTKTASLDKGYFKADFPRSYFPHNKAVVTTKTCLGTVCVTQKFNAAV